WRRALLRRALSRRGQRSAVGAHAAHFGGHAAAATRLGDDLPFGLRANPVHQRARQPYSDPTERPADARRRPTHRSGRAGNRPGSDVGERPVMRHFPAALVAVLVTLILTEPPAHAEETMVPVLAERAQVQTGPGFGYRVVYLAGRGEVLRAAERATRGYWFRIVLPNGTFGWILGEQVVPFDIDLDASYRPPSIWRRMGDAIFSPAPLADGSVEFTFSVGVLGGDGMFLFRPALLLDPHLSIEAYIGQSLGAQIDILHYGGGFNAYLWPFSAVTPFFAIGGRRGRSAQ